MSFSMSYTEEQILQAVENMVDYWDWDDLRRYIRQYIINERMAYYLDADNDELDMLIQDYGERLQQKPR